MSIPFENCRHSPFDEYRRQKTAEKSPGICYHWSQETCPGLKTLNISVIVKEEKKLIEFKKITEFPRGTIYDILQDAYSFDQRNKEIWDENWKETDNCFYDNPDIAEKYGLVTCLDGEPIGFITWDPRNRPEYVEIGHNGIREKYKGNGYGRGQLEEALNRIKSYSGLKRIIVGTNANLVAPKNYESVGFTLYDRKENGTESSYTGDYLYYEIVLGK